MQKQQTEASFILFYSYAHEDEVLREQLEKHLHLLSQEGIISEWHDRQIVAGTEWAKQIDAHLEMASIILLLVSPDFLASDYCRNIEMERALELHKQEVARVIPIILRPCDWQHAPFAFLQCLPRDGRAITEWENQDAAFHSVAQGIRRAIEQQTPRVLSSVARKNRLRLLKRMRETWIEGVLERSLHQEALISLNLHEQPDALFNPWNLQVLETNAPPRPLPAGTSITEVYEKADGQLLILGEPGSGKTTLMLELTRTLLAGAEQEERARLPIVFNLSSWAQRRQPLGKWLVEELWTKYQVPRKIGQDWLDADQILPLLDGLDEVAMEARAKCVQAINAYHEHHLREGRAVPLVVCCRTQEYWAQPTRVALRKAVSIQPLTEEQITCYLQSAKGQLEGLQQTLSYDQKLYELAQRPLMLSILTLTYQNAKQEDLPTEEIPETYLSQVFAAYVNRMLTRRGAPHKRMLSWLKFLAAGMKQHNQTVFYLEQLQPDWLESWYTRLLSRLSIGLLVGLLILPGSWRFSSGPLQNRLVSSLIFGLFFSLSQIQPRSILTRSRKGKKQGIVVGLGAGLLDGLLFGLGVWLLTLDLELSGRGILALFSGIVMGLVGGSITGVFAGISTSQLDDRMPTAPRQGCWRSIRNGVAGALLVGTVFGLLAGFLYGLIIGLESGLQAGVASGLFLCLLCGLPSGLVGGLFFGFGQIQPGGGRTRSWKETRRSILIGLSVGLVGGLGLGWVFEPPTGLISGLVSGLLFFSLGQIWPRWGPAHSWKETKHIIVVGLEAGLIGGLGLGLLNALQLGWGLGLGIGVVSALIFGLGAGLIEAVSANQLNDRMRIAPNQGIWRSLYNGVGFGLVTGLIFGLIVVLAPGGFKPWFYVRFVLLYLGPPIALFLGLGAFFQHFVLRFWLWCTGSLPWKLVAFLDKATERLLLHKVGGGYIFVHRMLLDYFASLEKK